jgi:hypothetical protein
MCLYQLDEAGRGRMDVKGMFICVCESKNTVFSVYTVHFDLKSGFINHPPLGGTKNKVKKYDYLCGHGQAEEEPNGAAAEGDGALPVLQGGGLDGHQALQGGVCTGR